MVTHKSVDAEVAEKALQEKVGEDAKQIVERNTRKRKRLAEILGVNKRAKTGDDMDVDQEQEHQIAMDTDKGALSLKKQMKNRKLQQTLARVAGADPHKLSTKVFTEGGEKLKRKIEKRLRHSVNIDFADRSIGTKMPKHLYSGKTPKGKRDYR